MIGITRKELIEQIEYEEFMFEDDEIVSFIPVELLNEWWRKFGGVFLQRENKRERTIEITYSNNHYTHRANVDITSMTIENIIKIMKCGLETGIDLFVSVNHEAVPIMWQADVEKLASKDEASEKDDLTRTCRSTF